MKTIEKFDAIKKRAERGEDTFQDVLFVMFIMASAFLSMVGFVACAALCFRVSAWFAVLMLLPIVGIIFCFSVLIYLWG